MNSKVNFAIALVFPALFNLLFFSIFGAQHNSTVWTAYLFVHFAYFALATTSVWDDSQGQPGERLYSLYIISGAYFLIVLALSCLFSVTAWDAPKICGTLLTAITLIYAFFFLSIVSANRHTASLEQRRVSEACFIDGARVKAQTLVDALDDGRDKELARELARLIESSPLHTNSAARELENQILAALDELLLTSQNKREDAENSDEKNSDIPGKIEEIIQLAKNRNRALTVE